MDKNYLLKLLRLLVVIVVFITIFYLFKVLFFYLYPFLIAAILSFLLHPLVTMMEKKWKMPRAIATLFTIVFFLSLFIFFILFLGIYIFEETTFILNSLPKYINQFLMLGEQLINGAVSFFHDNIASLFQTLPQTQQTVIMEYINLFLNQFSTMSTKVINTMVIKSTEMISSLSYMITITILILLSVYFMTNDFNKLKTYIRKYSPSIFSTHMQNMLTHLKNALFGFFKAQIIITFITGVFICIGLLIFQVEHAFTLSLIAFVIDFLPYVGIGVIFIPWIIYCFVMKNYVLTIQLTILYMVLIVLRQILEPKILADSIGINPLVALIVLFVGIQKWGIIGIFISPLILIVISAIYQSGIFHQIWNYVRG